MIDIDGAIGEGGGQILRSALTLALVTGKPFTLFNIRAKRPRPGLRPQHLKAVEAAAAIGCARVSGAAPGSTRLHFEPGRVLPGRYEFDIGTAGSSSLVLQTVYLPLALADGPSALIIRGGTHVPMSPCFHYLDLHWRRFIEAAGLHLTLKMERAGFYPPGGGIILASVQPSPGVKPLRLAEPGRLRAIRGLSAVANLDMRVAERQRNRALQRLTGCVASCQIAVEDLPAPSKGTMLLLLAEFEHSQACFFALGAPRKRAERVADEAVDGLCEFLGTGAAVDPFLADQLLLPLAFADGVSVLRTSRASSHLLTNAAIIRAFVPLALEIQGTRGEPATIRVRA